MLAVAHSCSEAAHISATGNGDPEGEPSTPEAEVWFFGPEETHVDGLLQFLVVERRGKRLILPVHRPASFQHICNGEGGIVCYDAAQDRKALLVRQWAGT